MELDRIKLLDDMIRAEEEELRSLKNQIASKREIISSLRLAAKLLKKPTDTDVKPPTGRIIQANSKVGRALKYLKEAKAPGHVNNILQGIGEEINRENQVALGSQLSTYVRKDEVFIRTAPNTFGLKEWVWTARGEEDSKPDKQLEIERE